MIPFQDLSGLKNLQLNFPQKSHLREFYAYMLL